MTIYTTFGTPVTITANCGEHKPSKGRPANTLVKTNDGKEDRYHFAFTLRADGGYNEIEAAIKAAPTLALDKAELKRAIEQAQ